MRKARSSVAAALVSRPAAVSVRAESINPATAVVSARGGGTRSGGGAGSCWASGAGAGAGPGGADGSGVAAQLAIRTIRKGVRTLFRNRVQRLFIGRTA